MHRHENTFGYFFAPLRVVYIDVPKVASTSIKAALQAGCPNVKPQVIPLDELRSIDGAFVFSFVRNPWDRLVSCWSDKIRVSERTDREFCSGVYRDLLRDSRRFRGGMPFDEFASVVLQTPDATSDIHVRSQCTFLHSESGELRPQFVGRFEALERDWARVCSMIGRRLSLPRIQYVSPPPAPRGPYRDFYDEVLAELVGDRYRNDVMSFGYAF